MNDFPQIIYKRHTFLSALAMGVSAIIIAFIISCTVVIIYGMNFAGDKSEEIVSLAEEAIRGLPKLQESLPPVLADMLNDRRQPDYSTQLTITPSTTLLPNDNGTVKTTIEIVNNGKEVVRTNGRPHQLPPIMTGEARLCPVPAGISLLLAGRFPSSPPTT